MESAAKGAHLSEVKAWGDSETSLLTSIIKLPGQKIMSDNLAKDFPLPSQQQPLAAPST